MKVVACSLFALSLLFHSGAAQADIADSPAPEDIRTPFLGGFLKETRVLYPLRIGDWEAQGEHLYEQQELGASVRYVHRGDKDRWIDLYFYPAGVLPASRLAVDAKAVVEGIRTTVGVPGGYSEMQVEPMVPLSFPVGTGKQREDIAAQSVSLHLVREGKAYSSALVLMIKDLYYIKGRFSAEQSALSQRKTRRQLEDFMREVAGQSRVISTGDCWMPMPRVQKVVLASGAPGQIASVDKEGALSAIAYADRVEALDVDSPEAGVMAFMAMVQTGRWLKGCLPVEDINPVVPEGMREIRLEFRTPANEGSDPSIPLRPGSTGVS